MRLHKNEYFPSPDLEWKSESQRAKRLLPVSMSVSQWWGELT